MRIPATGTAATTTGGPTTGGAAARRPTARADGTTAAAGVLAAAEQTTQKTASTAGTAQTAQAAQTTGSTSSQGQEEGNNGDNQSLLGEEEQTEDGTNTQDSNLSTNTQENGQEFLQQLLLLGTGLHNQFAQISLDVIGNGTCHRASSIGKVEVQRAFGKEVLGVLHEIGAHFAVACLNCGCNFNGNGIVAECLALTAFIGLDQRDAAEQFQIGIVEDGFGLAEELNEAKKERFVNEIYK